MSLGDLSLPEVPLFRCLVKKAGAGSETVKQQFPKEGCKSHTTVRFASGKRSRTAAIKSLFFQLRSIPGLLLSLYSLRRSLCTTNCHQADLPWNICRPGRGWIQQCSEQHLQGAGKERYDQFLLSCCSLCQDSCCRQTVAYYCLLRFYSASLN